MSTEVEARTSEPYNARMDCPCCTTTLIVLEYDEVEVDYCVDCAGIWLDAGELELLFGERALTEGFLKSGDPAAAAEEKPRKCPVCRRRMQKRVTGGDAEVVYDRCPAGEGLWFDQGELASILEHGSAAPGGDEVTAWLRALFPKGSPGAADAQ